MKSEATKAISSFPGRVDLSSGKAKKTRKVRSKKRFDTMMHIGVAIRE
jgi:hypothetical protein